MPLLQMGIPKKPIITDLSLAITWPVSFIEWADQEYTAAVTIDWVMWSNDVVVSVDLPSWISFVSASDWWTHSNWTITWNLWDTIANKNLTFTVGSTTPAEYVLSWEITAGYSNKWTKVASKNLEVLESIWFTVELRIDWAEPELNIDFYQSDDSGRTNAIYLNNYITFSTEYISWNMYKIWTINSDYLFENKFYGIEMGDRWMPSGSIQRDWETPFILTIVSWWPWWPWWP